jgi:hypothetical protein
MLPNVHILKMRAVGASDTSLIPVRLHAVMSQKTALNMVTAIRTSNLTYPLLQTIYS